MQYIAQIIHFPYPQVALKVAMSGGIGLLVGLEREWAKKEIGVRTFALSGLLGMLASLIAPIHVIAGLGAILLLVTFLNIHSLLKDRSLELTTSLCLVVVFFLGELVGLGHTFTAATSAIAMMMLLAWKLELERFAGALKPEEIRSAVLLGLLSVVIYPLLPDRFVDPWQMLNPREYWVTVMAIAGIGFLNYSLLRIYGNRGMYYAAMLGGLVNSTAAVAEISTTIRAQSQNGFGPRQVSRSVAILVLTNVAMFLRNLVILAIFAPQGLVTAAPPLGAMTIFALGMILLRHRDDNPGSDFLQLSSPVSLRRVAKFALIFLALAFAGTLARRFLGNMGFLAVSLLGGLVSSASTTATAATLAAAGKVSPHMAGIATVLGSISSSVVNIPLVHQQTRMRTLTVKLSIATIILVIAGAAALVLQQWTRHG